MTKKPSLIPACALIAALSGAMVGTTMLSTPAAAQGMPGGPARQMPNMMQRASHVEGRIAFLKAELKITPEQESLFAGLATAIRADVQDLEKAHQKMTADAPMHPTAVQLLERRVDLATLRVAAEQRFLTAFRPLYASLSAEQKQTADELLAQRGLR